MIGGKNMMAIDTAETVTAKWVRRRSSLYCPNCNKGYRDQKGQNPFLWNYCPNCGVRIEGAEDEKSDRQN
jgi:hypothetical protein